MMHILMIYLAMVNVIAFLMYGADKRKAMRHKWRISEDALMTIVAIGGSVGALIAMKLFRHKTRHPKFYIGVPLFLIIHICALIFVLKGLP